MTNAPRIYYVGRHGFRLFGKTYQNGDEFRPWNVPINQRKLAALIQEGYLLNDRPTGDESEAPAKPERAATVVAAPADDEKPKAQPSDLDVPEGYTVDHAGGGYYTITKPDGSEERVRGKAATTRRLAKLTAA